MAMRKGKFMPLSEADVSPSRVAAYDGQSVRVAGASDARLVMGNYLGGGIAGVVYEAYDARARRHVAVKILNPVGYKLAPPAALRRGHVVRRGVPVVGHVRGMTLDNVYWVRLAHKRDLVACYALSASAPAGAGLSASTCMPAMAPPANNSAGPVLRELTLEMCVSLWLLDHDDDELLDDDDRGADGLAPSNTTASAGRRRPRRPVEDPVLDCFDRRAPSDEQKTDDADELMLAAPRDDRPDAADEPPVPRMPAKFRSFLRARKTIFREIAHMHKLTGNSVSGDQIGGGHENVLKLYDVLELVQPSKSTIFLVLELAYGGELFDRIRSDQGVEESVARGYVAQLLAGVLYCHQLGIVHRDLKPENLLLSETDVLKIADFGLSAHFIAAVSNGHDAGDDDDENNDQCMLDNDVGSRLLAPPGARFRRLNSIVGSPHYVAPEVLQNARYGYDGRKADMWSIGVIIYGLLVGNLPFGKDLATCPRYLKFCEWVRALPSDPHSGKLLFQPELFQPGSVRLVSSSSSSSSSTAASPSSESSQPPLHPGFQPMLGMSSMLWTTNGQSNASVPPVAPPSVARMRSSNTNVSSNGNSCMNGAAETTSVLVTNGAVGRRGSRIVSFPSWFFPARLSPSAVFLIASLLHPDPARRFSCEDACKAAWVVDATR